MTRKKIHTVLIVEDDEVLRNTLSHHLEVEFEVVAVGTGEGGLEAIAQLARLDLVLTDFDLHGKLDGLDVARAAKQRSADLPVVLMTGSGRGLPRVQELLSLPGATLLAKPFHVDELDRAIRARLSERKEPNFEEARQV